MTLPLILVVAAILDAMAARAVKETPGFSGFAAERGRALHLGLHAGGDQRLCRLSHGQSRRHRALHKRGRNVAPMAVSANPKRFADAAEVEKRFERDCPNVLSRACTARKMSNFITYLSGQ